MNQKIDLTLNIKADQKGRRVDLAIAEAFTEFSRSHLQKLIKQGAVKVNGKETKPKYILQGNELIEIAAEEAPQLEDKPENIKLEIIYEDKDVLVINKSAGLVVHPGAGNPTGTLVNGLINLDSKLVYLPRAGIVHRLDKDTSGLMVIARNEKAYKYLSDQISSRTVKRGYDLIVIGKTLRAGTLDFPIGRHRTVRTKQSVTEKGKEALQKIEDITAEPEIGEIYTGRVVKTMDFGAFVNFMGAKDGLVHISELSNRRVGRTTDVVKVGDKVKVKVVGFDNRGKIKLSMKEVKQTSERDFNRA